jgi:thiol-disulfide isomerase/thioredoxin
MTLRRVFPLFVALVVAALPAAAAGKKVDEERVAALESRIAELEAQLGDVMTKMAEIEDLAMRDQRAEEAAQELTRLYNSGDHVAAKELLTKFQKEYAGTEAAKRSARMARELQVIGKPAPAQVNATTWYAGESVANLDLASGTSLVVFFEEWCPHCKREVPKMQATYEKFADKGLNMMACTKVTKSSTEEKVQSFVETNNLQFPVFKEDGKLSQYFNVSGIPAAAVVKDGKIVWRGHPANISDAMLAGWL